MTPGDYLRTKRKALRMSQDYVALVLESCPDRLTAWENNQSLPTLPKAIKLRDLYNFDMNEFMDIVRKTA